MADIPVQDLEIFGVQLGSGGEGIDGGCPIAIPSLPGLNYDIGSLGDLFILSGFLDALVEFINSLINSLLVCINDCYYNGNLILDVRDFFDIAGINIDDFGDWGSIQEFLDDTDAFAQAVEAWLNKPGLGTQINTFVQVHISPFIKALELICMALSWFFECIMGPGLLIIGIFFEKNDNGQIDFDSPKNIVDLQDFVPDFVQSVTAAAELLEKCFDLEIPWPFPFDWFCEWIFPYMKYVLPRICDDENDTGCIPLEDIESILDSIEFNLELPSVNVNLTCLLNSLIPIPDFEFDMKSLILFLLKFNLCQKDDEGEYLSDPTDQARVDHPSESNDFSVDIEFLAQFLGIVIKVPIMLFDKYISTYSCFVRKLLMSFDYDVDFESDIWSIIKAIFDFGIEDIFNEIKAALKGMLPDVDWDLVDEIQALEGWQAAMEKMIEEIPWLCIINCFMLDTLTRLVELIFLPVIELLKIIQDVVGNLADIIDAVLGSIVSIISSLFEFIPGEFEFERTGYPLLDLANILVLLLLLLEPEPKPALTTLSFVFILDSGENQWCLNVLNLVNVLDECILNGEDD